MADDQPLWDRQPLELAGQSRMVGQDIFRRAYVHFSLRRRFMRLHPPRPFGVMHWTYPLPMRIVGWINIYTVHDLIPLFQSHLSPVNLARHRAVLRGVVAHADHIVTVSETARSHIVALPGVDTMKVTNCGQGVDTFSPEMSDALPFGLQEKGYFLFCGMIEPRKNLARLIQAFIQSAVDIPLIIVGPDGWQADEINKEIAQAPQVIRIGFVDRRMLITLMRYSRALLFPSLAEGFGLPVIEAMQLGTPVLTSYFGALKEVSGDAALLVDPFDVGEMATAIARLSKDDVLHAELSRKGLIRAGEFSMDRFAERLRPVYDGAIAVRGGGGQMEKSYGYVRDRETC